MKKKTKGRMVAVGRSLVFAAQPTPEEKFRAAMRARSTASSQRDDERAKFHEGIQQQLAREADRRHSAEVGEFVLEQVAKMNDTRAAIAAKGGPRTPEIAYLDGLKIKNTVEAIRRRALRAGQAFNPVEAVKEAVKRVGCDAIGQTKLPATPAGGGDPLRTETAPLARPQQHFGQGPLTAEQDRQARAQYREYLRQHGLTDPSIYGPCG
jgi:hypothetical protein